MGVRLAQRPLLRVTSRFLTPAPSKSWDPGRTSHAPSVVATSETIAVTVHLPEEQVLELRAAVGGTLMDALEQADLSDVWPGGACGGMCSCSTCRVVVEEGAAALPERQEEEEDMLDVAAAAAARSADAEGAADHYLDATSRLGCQITLRREDDGLVIRLPDDVTNVLEVPLWLRGSR